MKRVEAFKTADGSVHLTEAAAKKAAQRRYDDFMTTLRVDLTKALDSHVAGGKALAWIEKNFINIDAACRLASDIFVEDDE